MTTDMAYNTSNQAYNNARMARDTEERINKELKENVINVDEAKRLANESRKLIKESKDDSTVAISESKKLIDEAMLPLPDLKAKETKGLLC